MRIVGLEAIPLNLPLAAHHGGEIHVAYGILRSFGNILVKIRTDEGLIGIGDTQSFPILGSGSQAALVSTLADQLQPCLVGEDPRDLNRLLAKMDSVVGGFYFAKHAIDMALHDLLGKILGVPVHRLFGGRVRDSLPTEAAFDIRAETVDLAGQAVRDGFKYIEVKCGGDVEYDVRLVERTREIVGPDVQLKIDLNAAYSYPGAKTFLRRLEPYHVDIVEQPLPAWDLPGLARLRQEVGQPIVLDESVLSVEHVMTAIRMGACDGIHLKPIRLGGLRNAWRMIGVLEAAGLLYIPGAMAASGVGTAAVNHLYGAAKHIYRGVPGSSRKYYEEDIIADPPAFGPTIQILDRPGIGVDLDDDNIERFRVR